MLYILIPEYTNYHRKHIPLTVQNASYDDYKNTDFYRAMTETIKIFESSVKIKPDSSKNGKDLMFAAFRKKGILSVPKKYKKCDGTEFFNAPKKNIEAGPQHTCAGVRDPFVHEEKQHLKASELFTENDCLGILSLLFNLFRRLDDAEKSE